MKVEIIVDDARLQWALARLIERGRDLSDFMRDAGEHLVKSTQRRFQTGTGPDGEAWAALKSGESRKPLTLTGRMAHDISPHSGTDFVEIVAHAKQARWHQEGTKPYVILPSSKKALAWAGGLHPVSKVNHPGLPPRPFIGASEEDIQYLLRLAAAYLEDAVEDGLPRA